MKHLLILWALAMSFTSNAQMIAGFENIAIPDNTFIKDAGPDGGFTSDGIVLPNSYTDAGTFDFWNGWVVSNVKDTSTAGFINEGASFSGSGYESENYAIAYAPQSASILLDANSKGAKINGMYICNSTYTALSMRDGDAFAKKFGGESGDDPDYLYLSVKKYLDGNLSSDSVLFYLADYRNSDNSLDYIIKDWTWLDLSTLGELDSLRIAMFSSDVGAFGINTPTYFCVDDINIDFPSSLQESVTFDSPLLYPNPAEHRLTVKNSISNKYKIITPNSTMVQEGLLEGNRIDISNLNSGIYFIQFRKEAHVQTIKFVKI